MHNIPTYPPIRFLDISVNNHKESQILDVDIYSIDHTLQCVEELYLKGS